MSIFVLLTTKETPEFETKVSVSFGSDSLKIAPNQWLVSSAEKTTTKEILESLGAEKGAFGQVVAFAISGYYGWHRTEIWEWIKSRWETA